MSAIDIERLLEPAQGDCPAGEDLEYDPRVIALRQEAEGKPEREMGGHFQPAEPPDWETVRRQAIELLPLTKDLRIAILLARASLATNGLGEFCDSLQLVLGYVRDFWDSVFPQLDPDDDNDPMQRVNELSSLCDYQTTLKLIDHVPLVRVQGIGSFALHDLAVAKGEKTPSDGEEAVDPALIHGAFMECDLPELEERQRSVGKAIGLLGELDEALTAKVGAAQACSFERLVKHLGQIQSALAEPLAERGVSEEPEPDEEASPTAGPGAPAQVHDGEVRTREDAIRALEKVINYYKAHEPSSPVRFWAERAKREASMDFLEIINDITPDHLPNVRALFGLKEGED